MTQELDKLRCHIGESTTQQDVATASQVGRLAATLNVAHPAPNPGDALPQGWYGIFFPSLTSTAELREDGQPGTGLVPPVPLPRRRLESVSATFHEPIRIGDALTKVSEVADVSLDEHDGAPVVGVTITETISAAGKLSVVERRSFRFFGEIGSAPPADQPSVPDSAAWSRRIEPSPVLMFRLSAVRFNTHRVHFDRDYTTKVEGMPGLAVPITLVSSQMIEMLREELPNRSLASIAYRSVKRIYDVGVYTIHGALGDKDVRLWATDHEGTLAVLAEATLAD